MHRVQPPELPAPAVPLSPGVVAGEFLFVSGQTATTADGDVYVGDFEREVHSCLDNVEAVLRAGGATTQDVVRVGAFLSNSALFTRFNAVYVERFGTAPPARTTVVVGFGHPDVRVEVEAIAYLGRTSDSTTR